LASIFLSHNCADKPLARQLAEDLKSLGVCVWIDEAEIQIGDSLIEKIREGIDSVDYVGVIISRHSVKSEWVKREVDIAMNQEIKGKRVKVLPLLAEDCDLPGFLEGKLYADLRTPESYQKELPKLAARLGVVSNTYSSLTTTRTNEILSIAEQPRHIAKQLTSFNEYNVAINNKKACLLISDGTEFSNDLEDIIRECGFKVEHIPSVMSFSELRYLDNYKLREYALVALVRGEHFGENRQEGFYEQIQRFVEAGGILFATSWVSWETSNSEFAKILPFSHEENIYHEDIIITCKPTHESLASSLLQESISYLTSFEYLKPKAGSTVLLETDKSIPILGFKEFGLGMCYYFNSCQHSCSRKMPSPLSINTKLSTALSVLLKRIHDLSVISSNKRTNPKHIHS